MMDRACGRVFPRVLPVFSLRLSAERINAFSCRLGWLLITAFVVLAASLVIPGPVQADTDRTGPDSSFHLVRQSSGSTASTETSTHPDTGRGTTFTEPPKLSGAARNVRRFVNRSPRVPEGRHVAVTGIVVREYDDRIRVTVRATGSVGYITSRIYNPPMLVMDLPGAVNRLPEDPLSVERGNLTRIRHSQYRIDPIRTVRVVLDLREWSDRYRVYRPAPGDRLVVDVFDVGAVPESSVEPDRVRREVPTPDLRPEREGYELNLLGPNTRDLRAGSGSPVSLRARVTDPSGKPLVGETVTFEVPADVRQLRGLGRGEGSKVQARTDVNGRVKVSYRADTRAGRIPVIVRVPRHELSDAFVLRVRAARAHRLIKRRGDRQLTLFGHTLPKPMVVEVRDEYGNPVPGRDVVFKTTTPGAMLDLDADTDGVQTVGATNRRGRVQVDFFRVSSTRKRNVVTARLGEWGDTAGPRVQFVAFGQPQLLTINFERANLRDVVRTLAEISEWNVVLPEAVNGRPLRDMTVTVRLQKVTALQALDTILDMKRLARVADGNVMKIVAREEAPNRGVAVLTPDELSDYEGNNLVTVTYKLKYLQASQQLKQQLQSSILAEASSVVADASSNALIVTDLVNNQRRLHRILQKMDQPNELFTVRSFKLQWRNAEKFAGTVRELLPTGKGNVVPHAPTNSILVYADPTLLDRIGRVVDFQDTSGVLAENFTLINVEGYDAEQIANQVNAILGLQIVPLEELGTIDLDIESAQEAIQLIRQGRQVDPGSLLNSASVIALPQLDSIIVFGPPDIRETTRRIIDKLKRKPGEYVQKRHWRWVTVKTLPLSDAEDLIQRMGGIKIQTKLSFSRAFLVSSPSRSSLDRLEGFLHHVDRDVDVGSGQKIITYAPQMVDPEELGDQIEEYLEDVHERQQGDEEGGVSEPRPRILFSGEDLLVLAISPSETAFFRNLMKALDRETLEDRSLITYLPRYLSSSALASQLEAQNLGEIIYQDEGRVSLLVPQSQEQRVRSLIESIDEPGMTTGLVQLQYRRAESVVETLNRMQSANESDGLAMNVNFASDPSTNSVVFTAPRSNRDRVRDLIARLDTRQKQVLINGLIMEYSLDEGSQVSPEFFVNPQGDQVTGAGDFTSRGGVAFNAVDAALQQLGQGTFTALLKENDFQAVLNVLSSRTQSNILSRPQITALNNEEASIRIGSEQQVIVSRQTAEGLQTSLETIEAFTELIVTPTITRGRHVRMSLTISSDDFVTGEVPEDVVTQINRRRTENSVLVRDGQTLVIGGLIEETRRETERGVPFLKDIPVVGRLFKATSQSDEKSELLVFLTPRVIRSDTEGETVSRDAADEATGLFRPSGLRSETGVAETHNINRVSRQALSGIYDRERFVQVIRERNRHGYYRSWDDLRNRVGLDEDDVALLKRRFLVEIPRHDLNRADARVLKRLPGVDRGVARNIVDYRASFGPFRAVKDLTEVPGVSDSLARSLRDYLYVSPSPGDRGETRPRRR